MQINIFILILALLSVSLTQGCAPVIVAGAATGVSVANDRRTAGAVLEDQSIELKTVGIIQSDKSLSNNSHISVTSYNGIVLLTGQVPVAEIKNRIANETSKIEKVKRVHNELKIANSTDFKTRSNDTWITTKTKSTLLGAKGIESVHVKVITEDGVVYLMGMVTREEANTIAKTVQQVKGVRGVIKVFEYLN
ncbi:MAG: BON domain-containing protein [Gammaproteobacteria bacterium]